MLNFKALLAGLAAPQIGRCDPGRWCHARPRHFRFAGETQNSSRHSVHDDRLSVRYRVVNRHTIVPTSAQALNQWKCTGKPDFSPEEQITGCSGAIRSGKLVGKDLAAAFTIRGSAYRVHGDLKRSVEDYNQAAKLDPKNADIFYRRGIALGMSGEADRAIGDFDQAIKLEPDHVGALYSRGLTHSNKG
jgi:tetratricopeptide (TPR) repeat protein